MLSVACRRCSRAGTRGLQEPAAGHLAAGVSSRPIQQQSKARKPRSKSKSKIELLKKCLEDKIQLFDEQAPEDLAEKVSAPAPSASHCTRLG